MPGRAGISVLFVTPRLDDNSTGRTYALWLLAQDLGWTSKVVSFRGADMWAPLQGTKFAEDCVLYDFKSRRERVRQLESISAGYDLVVAVKPLEDSLGLALAARGRRYFPLVVDIDDPDLEIRMNRRPYILGLLWRLKHLRFWVQIAGSGRIGTLATVLVSNPALQSRHGGWLIPHVREDNGSGAEHTRDRPVVAFVGTPRAHKGIELLRHAVSALSDRGFRLIITADPPPDAAEWEEWVGSTSIEDGLRIVENADIVVIPSVDTAHANGQLPAKLVDAMILGRAVIVSDVDPLPWAVGSAGKIVCNGDLDDLVAALDSFASPVARAANGTKMRDRAIELFTVRSVKRDFESACRHELEHNRRKLQTAIVWSAWKRGRRCES